MKRTHLVFLALLLLVSALLVIGCDEGDRTMIGTILDRPNHYMDRDVIIAGRVTSVQEMNLRISDAGVYRVDDGSGRIWVITKRGVPDRGDEVGLKGRVDGGFRLFGDRYGVVIREYDRRIKHHSDDYYLDRRDNQDRNKHRDADRERDWNRDRDRDRNYDRDSYDRDYDRNCDRD